MARDYAKIAPTFWTGATGRAIVSSGTTTITLAFYLLTCPHAEATGLYRLPVAYAMADTGLDREEIERAMITLIDLGFVEVDEERLLVWVREMGAWQIGETLSKGDKRRKMVVKRLAPHKASPLFARFAERYGDAWGLPPPTPSEAPSDAPSMGHGEGHQTEAGSPMPCQEQEQEQEQENDTHLHTPTPEPTRAGASRPTLAPSASGGGSRKPQEAPRAAEPSPAPEAPPALAEPVTAPAGAFSRLLGRYETDRAAKEPPEGRSIRFLADPRAPRGKRGALIFGGRGRTAPGPWAMPPEVYDAVEDRLFAPVPRFTLPRPPMLPPKPEGVAHAHEPDDALVEAMLVAWRAVYRRHTGKAYKGNAGKRGESVAEAARMLRAEGASAWTFLDWAWTFEHERTRKNPTLFGLAAPNAVGRLLHRFRCDAPTHDGIVPTIEARDELLEARQVAEASLRRERPTTAEAAVEIVDRSLPAERYTELVNRTELEVAALRTRVATALARGHWIWTA